VLIIIIIIITIIQNSQVSNIIIIYLLLKNLANDKPEEESIELLKICVSKLPPQNREVLCYFLRFMSRVADEEEENKMGAKNLGVVFGSILLGSASLVFSLEMKQLLNDQSTVVQRMIANVDELFPVPEVAI
jgi:hypothetical protein